MFFKKSLVFVFTVFVFCDSAFVDRLSKCEINDSACGRDLYQSIIKDIAKTGVPELGIPRIDPFAVNNISVSVLNFLDLTLVEGRVKGAKDCTVDKYVTNIEDGRIHVELTCDISLKGHYKAFASSPLVKQFFGGDTVHGDGKGKVKIEKLHLRIDYFVFIQRRNGELYIKCKADKTVYSYDIKGRMTLLADNLYIGDKESSKLVTGMLNENWRLLMSSFGKPFMDKAMELMYDFLYKFFDNVPTKYYIASDLSSYARDE